MDSAKVQQLLEEALNLQEVHVKGEGRGFPLSALCKDRMQDFLV